MGAEAWSPIRAGDQRRQKGIGTIKRRRMQAGSQGTSAALSSNTHPGWASSYYSPPGAPAAPAPHRGNQQNPPTNTMTYPLDPANSISASRTVQKRGWRRFESGENVFPDTGSVGVAQHETACESPTLQEGPGIEAPAALSMTHPPFFQFQFCSTFLV